MCIQKKIILIMKDYSEMVELWHKSQWCDGSVSWMSKSHQRNEFIELIPLIIAKKYHIP